MPPLTITFSHISGWMSQKGALITVNPSSSTFLLFCGSSKAGSDPHFQRFRSIPAKSYRFASHSWYGLSKATMFFRLPVRREFLFRVMGPV